MSHAMHFTHPFPKVVSQGDFSKNDFFATKTTTRTGTISYLRSPPLSYYSWFRVN